MLDHDRRPISRRTLLLTIVMVAVVVSGIVLFFVYEDRTEPLLPSITNTGVNE
jgi:hypothetical protein